METLRISPQYKADEWRRLDKTKQEDWTTAADIVPRSAPRTVPQVRGRLPAGRVFGLRRPLDRLPARGDAPAIHRGRDEGLERQRAIVQALPRRTTVRNVIHSSADVTALLPRYSLWPLAPGRGEEEVAGSAEADQPCAQPAHDGNLIKTECAHASRSINGSAIHANMEARSPIRLRLSTTKSAEHWPRMRILPKTSTERIECRAFGESSSSRSPPECAVWCR